MSTIKTLGELLKLLKALSAVFAFGCVGIFFLQLSSDVKNITVSTQQMATATQQTLGSVQKAVGPLQQTVDATNAAMVDLRRVILIAGGTLNIARDTLRREQSSIQEANQQTISTMKGVNKLVDNVDVSQKEMADNVSKTLQSIQPVMSQTQQTLATTQETIAATKPMIENLNGMTGNLNKMSAQVETVVSNGTKPQPWYKKAFAYAWAPIKIVAIFAK